MKDEGATHIGTRSKARLTTILTAIYPVSPGLAFQFCSPSECRMPVDQLGLV
jgi:hypothetical protein